MTKRFSPFVFIALCSLLALSCATSAKEPREKAWQHFVNVTGATYLGNDELRLVSKKRLLMNSTDLEYALLARASGEALARNYAGFAITQIGYKQDFDLLRIPPPLVMISPLRSYAELQEYRLRQVSRLGRVRRMTFIITLIDQETLEKDGGFDADETHSAMIDLRVKLYD